jgi:hypothetical protein
VGFLSNNVASVRLVAGHTGSFFGQDMLAGDIYTVLQTSGHHNPSGVGADQAGNLLVANAGGNDRSW